MTEKPNDEKSDSPPNDSHWFDINQKNDEKPVPDIQKRYEDLIERSPIGIFRTTSEGQSLFVNSAMAAIMGFTSHEEMNRYYRQIGKQVFVHPERREEFLQLLRENGHVENFEYEARTVNDDIIWLSLNAQISEHCNDGSFIIDGFATDVTNRKRAEESLRKSETHLRTLLDTIPDLVWLKDLRGVYLGCNSRFETFFGAKEEEIIGKTDYEFVDKEVADFFRENDIRAIKAGKACKNEEKVVFKTDGHQEIVETIKTPMFSADGDLVGVLGIGRDISERKRAEQEREILIAAIEQAGDMITLTDPNAIIQYANTAFERVTGFRREEVIGHTPQILDSTKPDETFFKKAWETVSSDRTWKARVVHRRKDGTCFTVDASISPIHDESKKIVGYVSVERDVTDKLRLEAQFLQSQKIESVGRLAGGVAHDFNNMLNVILGNAELAMLKVSPGDPLQSHLKAIVDAGNRSSAITRQLLAFARKQAISPKILDLNETIEGLLKMIRRLIRENIDLVWKPKATLWQVRIDPSQVDQILVNLCLNARDAISEVGKITIETGNITFDEDYCAGHENFIPGEFILLSVSDNGKGMDREVLSHIFEPFFTTKEVGKGTGLGLATSFGIVNQNNGFINAYSEPGMGTIIKVYLPRYKGDDEVMGPKITSDLSLGNGETILLVEDEEMTRDVIQQMLINLGYKVLAATNPKKAISLANQYVGEIDLLLTDVVMPEMNGRELAAAIKTFLPTIKIIFISGYTSTVIAQQGFLEEGINLLQKPFSMNDLAVKIKIILGDSKS